MHDDSEKSIIWGESILYCVSDKECAHLFQKEFIQCNNKMKPIKM